MKRKIKWVPSCKLICKIMVHCVDEPEGDIVNIDIEDRGATGPLSPHPLRNFGNN